MVGNQEALFIDDLNVLVAKELSTFEAVCTQMLEDVQERLVYRTQVYIRTEILGYKPSPGDIAYPEKLEMMQVDHRWFVDHKVNVLCLNIRKLRNL